MPAIKPINGYIVKSIFSDERHPVLDASISQPSEDLPNLFVRSYILGIKVTEAGIFIFAHDGGQDITRQEKWDLQR